MNILFGLNQSSDNYIEEKILEAYKDKTGNNFTYKKEFDLSGIVRQTIMNRYDVLVLNELLERQSTVSTDFIDSITDKHPNLRIILVVDSEEHKKDSYIKKLFNMGIYDVVYSHDLSIEILVDLINKPRTKMEAKIYLELDEIEDVVVDKELKYIPETELESILSYFKSIDNDEVIPAFEHVNKQYNEEQMIFLLDYLPENIKEVLKDNETYKNLSYKANERKKIIRNIEVEETHTEDEKKRDSLFNINIEPNVKVIQKKETLIQSQIIGSVFIGIANAIRGAGSTYISMALANYLKNTKQDVAIVEMNPNPYFANLAKDKTKKYIQVNGIDIYYMPKKPYKDDFPIPLLVNNYKYIIADLGLLKRIENNIYVNNKNYYEFLRSNVSILMVSGAEWKWGEVFPFLIDDNFSKWTIYVSPTSDKTQKTIYKSLSEYTKNIYFLPYTSDPLQPSEKLSKVFEQSLGSYIYKEEKKFSLNLPKVKISMPNLKNIINKSSKED